jgi:hypothetical protein
MVVAATAKEEEGEAAGVVETTAVSLVVALMAEDRVYTELLQLHYLSLLENSG